MTTRANKEVLQAIGLLVTTLPPSQRMEYVRLINGLPPPVSSAVLQVMEAVKLMAGKAFNKKFDEAKSQLETNASQGIGCLAFGEEYFPDALSNMYDPPTCLFTQGTVDERLVQQSKVAVVGSRRSNREGEEIAFSFAKALSQESIVVVSGLALGIDSAAHKGAIDVLDTGLKTIGILGSGFNKFYPPYNRELRDKILSADGLIISQFPPECPPYPANFLNRNRVIAGLSRATIVVQATARSGSLATARFALEEGRELLVVPGGIYDLRYEGSLQLLKQGAGIVTNSNDIFELLDIQRGLSQQVVMRKSSSPLMAIIEKEGRIHADKLKRMTGQPNSLFESEVLELEMQGYVEREAGNYIRLVRT